MIDKHGMLSAPRRLGLLFALATFATWTLYPLLWSALTQAGASPMEVLAHRIVGVGIWGMVALGVTCRKSWRELRKVLREPTVWGLCLASGLLIRGNWLVCIWSVSSGHLIDASVGFFLTPLLAAAFGVVFFGDRLSPAQRGALAVVALGIAAACVQSRQFPWIALSLSATNAAYVALRKKAPVDAVLGLCMESVVFVPLALGYLIWLQGRGAGVFGVQSGPSMLLLLAGLLTTGALLGHVAAGKRLSLPTLGLIQFFHPVGQFALGTLLFHESVTTAHKMMLACLVPALCLYVVSNGVAYRRSARTA